MNEQPSAEPLLEDIAAGLPGFYVAGAEYGLQATLRPSSTLFVGFDDISKVRVRRRIRRGWGYLPARKNGWAYLGVQTYAENWYRDAEVIATLERLRDQGFFSGYERVIFSGVSMGAFAACAFAPLAPGCIVIAYSPQSTLHPEIAGWDSRYLQGREQDWTLPYSDAASGITSARRVWVISDPHHETDRLHAERLCGKNVIHLPALHSGHFAMGAIRNGGILSALTAGCADLTMSRAEFVRLYKKVRNGRPYLEQLAKRVIASPSDCPKHLLHHALLHRKRPWIAGQVAKSFS